MLFRLCLAGHDIHPDYLLPRLTSAQITEWQAYAELEPWGFGVDNLMHGHLLSMIANIAPKKRPKRYKPQDFMLRTEKPSLVDKIKSVFGIPKR